MKTAHWSRFTRFLLLLLFSEYLVMLLSWVSHPADELQLDWQQPLKQSSTCRRFCLEQISRAEGPSLPAGVWVRLIMGSDPLLGSRMILRRPPQQKKAGLKIRTEVLGLAVWVGPDLHHPHLVMFCEHKQTWNPKWCDSCWYSQDWTCKSIIYMTEHHIHHWKSTFPASLQVTQQELVCKSVSKHKSHVRPRFPTRW